MLQRPVEFAVGASAYSMRLIEKLQRSASGGLQPVCVFDERPDAATFSCGLPVVRSLGALAEAVKHRAIDELWLVLTFKEEERIHAILREFKHDFVNIRFIPNVHNFAPFTHAIDEIAGVPAINRLLPRLPTTTSFPTRSSTVCSRRWCSCASCRWYWKSHWRSSCLRRGRCFSGNGARASKGRSSRSTSSGPWSCMWNSPASSPRRSAAIRA